MDYRFTTMYDQYGRPYEQMEWGEWDKPMTKEKLRPGTVKYIEQEIEYYHESLKMIEKNKRNIILSSPVHDDTGGGRSNLPGDPTGKAAMTILSNEEIAELERTTKAIQEVFEGLNSEEQKLVQLRYWKQKKWDAVAHELGASDATMFRWKMNIIRQIAKKLGKV